MAQLSARGGFLDFSPTNKDIPGLSGDKENNSLPILSLVQFSRAPFVTFGAVKLGSSKSAVLRIENHSDDGATEVTVDRIASTRGFSADQNRFKIQPGDCFDLTITWTPVEEGGVRELITFFANGVVKHQAILLGRAEAPKKKKKSLWDSIKNKKGADLSTPRGNKTTSSLKKAANKTFHVSRNPQYKREKVRSPLASLNDEVAVRGRSLSRCSPVDNSSERLEQPKICTPFYRQRSQALLQQGNSDDAPIVLRVPSAKIIDSFDTAAGLRGPVGTPECRDITRVLNRTLSPVGTPDRLKNLMPRIESIQSPVVIVSTLPGVGDTAFPGTPVLSVRDALAMIESDLTSAIDSSPPNACSSFEFSDSLESGNGDVGCGTDKSSLRALPDSPSESDPTQPRLTFIKPKLTVCQHEDLVPPRVGVEGGIPQAKKFPFTSATMIKSKAAPAREVTLGERKIKTSRRRLLEKTLELPDGVNHSQSSPSTPGLPVIDSDISPDGQHNSNITGSLFEVRHPAPDLTSVSLTSDRPVPVTTSLSPPLLRVPSTPQHPGENELTQGVALPELASAPLLIQPDLFPVHSQSQFDMVVRSKKRKSDEFLMNVEKEAGAEKTVRVKRSRVSTLVNDPMRTTQEKRSASLRQRTAGKKKGIGLVSVRSACSLKATKSVALAQAKQPSLRAAPRAAPQCAQPLKSFGTSSVKTKVVAVAQSKLTFIKHTQSAIPRHPMPFAAKNMFYDERWIEKQESGFTSWINYVLTPDDFKVNTEVTKVNAVSLAMGSDDKVSVPKAPTKEEMSLSTYTARRRLNRLRRAACQLFTSEAMVKAIQRLELEIEAKRLLVRRDRHLWKDIGERQKVLNWLLSYNPLWLRIGLETIYGEMISLESNSDVMGLAMFILRRMLWNPDIAAEFRHAKVPNLYKDGHEEALSRFTLKKLLLLVCFLDKAKESRMIEHDPCLFCMDAEFKTTKDLLLAFSRDFLSGEGILPRHLGFLGLPVSHVQTPLDEFNYAVENLAVDLKCGIRLVRVMELFMQDWSFSRKLRMPAISRLQKVHNVDIALQVLRAKGVDLTDEHGAVIDSRDIVDGHREKTLSLLWKIIFVFQVEVLLDEEQLREEICFLKRTWSTKQKLASLRADQSVQQRVPKSWTPFEHNSQKITLLMDWVNAVCEFHNLRVENFTVSFSDGRVLCYLIHHYHPSHLPVECISQSTSQTVECSVRGRVELNCSSSDSDSSFDTWPTQNGPKSPTLEFKELLENEKNNFRLINTAVSFLGGVPAMINPADMSNTIPNEKVVMSYLSFLCARLLDLRNETRAARVIQSAWRKYRLRKDLELFQERNSAAAKIQVLVRNFLQRRRTEKRHFAAISIQAAWRGYAARNALTLMMKAKLQILKNTAATAIQAQWRRYIAMKKYQCLRSQVLVIQAHWRMKRAVSAYRRIQWAATMIQNHTRAWILARKERGKYLSLRSAAVKIQRSYRRCTTQRLQKKIHAATVIQTAFRKWHNDRMDQRTAAALKIQSWIRMHKSLNQYVAIRQSAILIQAWYRGQAQRRNFQMLKLKHHSATIIQSAFRASLVRRLMERMRHASVIIQCRFRAYLLRKTERQKFLTMKSAAITIQAVFRGHMTRRMMEDQHQAATVIQANFRKFVAQKRFFSLKRATVTVQQQYRAKLLGEKSKEEYVALRCAALKIQAAWRGRAERKRIEKLHKYATTIQAHYRRHAMQSQFRSRRTAALVIQQQFRAHKAGKEMRTEYLQVKKAVIALQAGLRGMRVRKELKDEHQAATVIQSSVRAFICKRRYFLLQSAAIILQSHYRAHLVGKSQLQQYSQLKQATLKLQAAYRGYRVRRDLRSSHIAATVIQAVFRRHREKVKFQAMRLSAIIIQRQYRLCVQRKHDRERFLKLRDSAIVIQAAFRGHCVRSGVAKMRRAATVIQANYRMHKQQSAFRKQCWAVAVLQQRFRAQRHTSAQLKQYQQMRSAVILLQAAFRGMRSRQHIQKRHKAASIIQRSYRAHVERMQYLAWRSSILVIQQRYRATMAAKRQMQNYQHMRSAAVLLQATCRGQRTRRKIRLQHQAATVIQAVFRRHREEVKFQATRLSAIIIQRQYRLCVQRKQDRERFLKLRDSAIVIQAAFRGHCVRSGVAKMRRAATVIQANYRMHKQQSAFRKQCWAVAVLQQRFRAQRQASAQLKQYQQMRSAVILLQAAFRGMRSRQRIQKRHKAASIIQRSYRAHLERMQYLALRSSILAIQQRYRATMEAKRQMQNYQRMRTAAVLLQATCRGQRTRKKIRLQHQAATVIQAVFRRHREEVKFQAMRLSAIIIQRQYRSCVQRKHDRERFLKLRDSAIVIQAAFRGHCVRSGVAKMRRAATVIQANYRMHKQQSAFRKQCWAVAVLQQRFRAQRQTSAQLKQYQQMRSAVILLQAAFRGMRSRQRIQKRHKAASIIQRSYRAHVERMQYLAWRSSILVIQQRYRATMAAKRQMQNYQHMRSAAVLLQATCRGQRTRRKIRLQHQAATVIQAVFRRHREEVKFQATRLSAIIIQRQYRLCVQRKQDRERFLKLRDSAIVIQAAFRGHCVRSGVAKMRRAATVIQANYRMHKQQSAFRKQCWAVAVLQQRFRAQRQASAQLKQYQQMRSAVILLQAAFRGMRSRQRIQKRHKAASIIQRSYRAHLERMQYLALRSSILAIQQRYRATMEAKRQMQNYQRMRTAAVLLQATCRGQRTRKKIRLQYQAATVIQAVFRRHREEVKFQAMRLSAIIIQRQYRSCVQRKHDRERFLKLRDSAIVIQAAFRGHCVRSGVAKMRRAATVIQANYRMHKQQSAFRKQCWAVAVLQQRFRAQRQTSAQLKQYQQMRSAVILLQAAFRGMRSRQRIQKRHKAASIIQRSYRAHLERMQYLALRSSILAIQQRYRATMEAKRQMQNYQRMRTAAVLLQATCRGQQTRRKIRLQHQAATVIQAVFRRHREEVKFQAMRLSAIIIQRQYRSCVQRKQDRERFLKLRDSAIVIQAAFRGHCVRSGVAKMCRAATVIQANYRMHKQQSAFRKQCWAVAVLQQRFRAQRQTSAQLKQYQQMRSAVILLQAAFRGMRSRQRIQKRHKAASIIQRSYRAHVERMQYLALRSSILVIQQRYRATMAAKRQMQNYQHMRSAAVLLQATYRGQRTRRKIRLQHQAATVIQAVFRRHREEVKFQAMRLSAIIIQRQYRSCVQRKQDRERFLKLRDSAIVIQAAFRGHCVRSGVAKMCRAATVIQANYRMHKQQSAFRKQCWAVAVLQQRYRGRRAQRDQRTLYLKTLREIQRVQARVRGHIEFKRYQKLKKSAITIQAFYRGMVERRQLKRQRASVAIIQEHYMAALLCQRERAKYLAMKKSAVLIQSWFRGNMARHLFTERQIAVTTVHRCIQAKRLRNRFLAIQHSTLVIQRRWKETLKAREECQNFLRMKVATVNIQAAWRGHRARQHLLMEQKAAVLIQSSYRSCVQRGAYLRQREAILLLQRSFRALRQARVERENFTRMRDSAIILQKHCRSWMARRLLHIAAEARRRQRFSAAVFHHLCAMRIQRAMRAHWALQSAKRDIHSVISIQRWFRARQQRRHYLKERRKVITVQRAARRCLAHRHQAASVIQHAAKRFLLLRRQQRVEQGIIKAQALWRGHCSRKLSDNRKMVAIRHRLRKASQDVEVEDRLCNKTSTAIDNLLRYKQFSDILQALKNLEIATRLSPECCETLVESGATQVIFSLIQRCNRSIPCMEVITFAIQVLLNLSKYHKTIEAVYTVEKSVDTLVDLLQIYRQKAGDKVADKGGSIFTKACFLLILLLQDKHRALEVRKLPKTCDRIRSIYRITLRKHKMDVERTVTKQKIDGSFLDQATPRKFKPVAKFAPDWVLRKDSKKDIVDPLVAIQMLADVL